MTPESELPVSDAEADAAFASLARFDRVILAVSGGPDSMALMVLAVAWRARAVTSAGPSLSVVTVDHGLRSESRREAEMVGEVARSLGLAHEVLIWDGAKPNTGLPMAAREARYRLLEDHALAGRRDRTAVVTAHHRDDQAETFAMRLARGAGVDGLSGMRSERPLRDGSVIALARPFLAMPKSRLIATLTACGIVHSLDPTNSDLRYERARVRSLLPALESAGLSPETLATSARRLGDAREALDYAERGFAASLSLSFGNEVFASLDRRAFEAGPAFLRQKIVARLIARYGGASPKPQLSEVEELVARMQREGASAATLGGAEVSWGTRAIRIWREAGRLQEAEIALPSGETHVWDARFVLRWCAETAKLPVQQGKETAVLTLKSLGQKGYAAVVPRLVRSRRPPTRAASALPSFWAGDELVAVPSLAAFAVADVPPLNPAGFELTALAAAPF